MSDDDTSILWIRCAQNSLKKLEGAEVSMQLRCLLKEAQYKLCQVIDQISFEQLGPGM
jgi:hypothetical protein